MGPAPFKVVLDANVLYPFTLRDTLLRAAAADYYQAYWTREILDEVTRNLVGSGRISAAQAQRLAAAMARSFPEAFVKGYEELISVMPNHEKDRHVAAAAVKAGAQVIVTSNLSDFQALPPGVEAQSPDVFLVHLLDLDPEGFLTLLDAQASALRNPPRTVEDLLEGLRRSVPNFVNNFEALRSR